MAAARVSAILREEPLLADLTSEYQELKVSGMQVDYRAWIKEKLGTPSKGTRGDSGESNDCALSPQGTLLPTFFAYYAYDVVGWLPKSACFIRSSPLQAQYPKACTQAVFLESFRPLIPRSRPFTMAYLLEIARLTHQGAVPPPNQGKMKWVRQKRLGMSIHICKLLTSQMFVRSINLVLNIYVEHSGRVQSFSCSAVDTNRRISCPVQCLLQRWVHSPNMHVDCVAFSFAVSGAGPFLFPAVLPDINADQRMILNSHGLVQADDANFTREKQ